MPLTSHGWPRRTSRAVVFNTEAAYLYLSSGSYRNDVRYTNAVYCDGVGLQFYIALRFCRMVRRNHGPDLFLDYLSSRRGSVVHFVGGTTHAHDLLRRKHPEFFECNTVSIDSGTLDHANMQARAREIASANYTDVLIFLGLGKQEHFQRLLHESGFNGSSIGLGAALDFVSGAKPRAGRIWQMVGLEWLPRLLREPRMRARVIRSFKLFWMMRSDSNLFLRSYLFGRHS